MCDKITLIQLFIIATEHLSRTANTRGEYPMYTYALNWLKSFANSDESVTAIEYGLIAALIAVVIISAVTLVGTELSNTFDTIQTELEAANS